jgi:hypothetical protein
MTSKLIAISTLAICSSIVCSGQPTMGLFFNNTGSEDGYVLFSPIMSNNTYLIDKCGKEVHRWNATRKPGQSVYLLPDGSLLRPGSTNNMTFNAGGSGGIIERFDWGSSLLWSYTLSDTSRCQHHDVCYLPNGNILAIVWERKTIADAIASGRNPALTGASFWSEEILELQPTGATTANVVWEWHAWDHLCQDFSLSLPGYVPVSDHPELININYYTGMPTNSDWLHINAVAYNAVTDQVMLSIHNFNEVWIIDHSTTAAEAATHAGGDQGKGGDLLYRWGNPAAYNNGTAADRQLYGQHNAHWIGGGLPDSGKIIVFNNGQGRPGGNYSTIDIIAPPINATGGYSYTPGTPYLPAMPEWTYAADTPTNFYGTNISGVQRLPGGNTLICTGPSGTFFEIDAAKQTVWKYINPVNGSGPLTQGAMPTQNLVFRCTFYDAGYAGLAGHSLTPGLPIEVNPIAYDCGTTIVATANVPGADFINVVNPFSDAIVIKPESELKDAHLCLLDATGKRIQEWDRALLPEGILSKMALNVPASPGLYVLEIESRSGVRHFQLMGQ